MKNPGWPVLVVALLLGLVTGDSVLVTKSQPSKQQEVTVSAPLQQELSWQIGYPQFFK